MVGLNFSSKCFAVPVKSVWEDFRLQGIVFNKENTMKEHIMTVVVYVLVQVYKWSWKGQLE